jgi:CheY-like chemotaxis protein
MKLPMKNWQNKPRVLIIDDDDDFMSDLKILLSSEFDIDTASGTQQAWEMLNEHHPDCMLLDLNMPNYFGDNPDDEGFSFLEHIRGRFERRPTANIPVIVLTASKEARSLNRAREFGISDLYHKPPDIKRLKTSIWSLLENMDGKPT